MTEPTTPSIRARRAMTTGALLLCAHDHPDDMPAMVEAMTDALRPYGDDPEALTWLIMYGAMLTANIVSTLAPPSPDGTDFVVRVAQLIQEKTAEW